LPEISADPLIQGASFLCHFGNP